MHLIVAQYFPARNITPINFCRAYCRICVEIHLSKLTQSSSTIHFHPPPTHKHRHGTTGDDRLTC